MSAQASVAQLVALFSRFEPETGPRVVYRLLTGRMKGQAFITLPDAEIAQRALQLVHGYRLLGKPLVVEFGRDRQEEEKQKEKQPQCMCPSSTYLFGVLSVKVVFVKPGMLPPTGYGYPPPCRRPRPPSCSSQHDTHSRPPPSIETSAEARPT
ncbi:hypothetical protein INR49_027671 [Caranx melampygus]|nr:hypothetical protein INR49_027671 [Caranx melampygus]